MSTSLRSLPASDRPRERLLRVGREALGEGELLALLLRHGHRDESALSCASRLLQRFGSLPRVALADARDLARLPGVGLAKGASLVAAFELGRRVNAASNVAAVLRGPADVAAAASGLLAGATRERVVVVVANTALRVLAVERVSEGGIDSALFPVREILVAVLRNDGRAFAIAHNHPSGDPSPSAEDRATTVCVRRAAEAVGLRFLDHVIVAGEEWRRVEES